jgi:DNA-binding NarL/FixJ family response regulator
MYLLFVDDRLDDLNFKTTIDEIVKQIKKKYPHAVVVKAYNQEQALACVEAYQKKGIFFSIGFIDQIMNVADEGELLGAVLQKRFPYMTLVMFTASDDPQLVNRLWRNGYCGYLSKGTLVGEKRIATEIDWVLNSEHFKLKQEALKNFKNQNQSWEAHLTALEAKEDTFAYNKVLWWFLGLLLNKKSHKGKDLSKYIAKLEEKCEAFIQDKYPDLGFKFTILKGAKVDSIKKKKFLVPIREFCKIQKDFIRSNKDSNVIGTYRLHLSIKNKIEPSYVNQALLFLHQIAEKRFFDPDNQDSDIDFNGMIRHLGEINEIKIELYDKKEIPNILRTPDLTEAKESENSDL